jgi:predicted nucleotide-binding protein
VHAARVRPSVFVGSSSEGLRIAQAVQVVLDPVCEVEIWSQGVFGLTHGTLESLVLALQRFDFAVLVLTADDLTTSRGTERPVARDNVLFELGMFVGGLSRDRTFMLYDRTHPPALPTDLAGITAATFEPHSSGNLQAALGAACTRIQIAIERLGVRGVAEGPTARRGD